MTCEVEITKKALKNLKKLPKNIQAAFYVLIGSLEKYGPVQSDFPNYSKLENNRYHCHLTYRYVACWKCYKKSIEIEVYYVGSREKAPY